MDHKREHRTPPHPPPLAMGVGRQQQQRFHQDIRLFLVTMVDIFYNLDLINRMMLIMLLCVIVDSRLNSEFIIIY